MLSMYQIQQYLVLNSFEGRSLGSNACEGEPLCTGLFKAGHALIGFFFAAYFTGTEYCLL